MEIQNSQLTDIPKIFELYRIASAYMESKKQVPWPEFQQELVLTEIEENRQWKLLIDDQIVCVWATALNDELIWGIKNNESAIYIHRIAVNPNFRGQNLVGKIVGWANAYGQENNLKFIRMDTVGLNKGLIGHYQKHGFQFLGTKKLENTNGLPDHYKQGEVCYFQREIK
ncbi:GNAT family N-acetyltransferase [Flagellimonas sp. HMM57]|uniref:GNAT family N-acetyltransferase n=1 Tax=unclassified Flagellimonas TaxID=2644544 RepID=UPI0013D531F6|nr:MULTISPECIES: GNAT family N-acetyltransferase [unclassified Flagellimonas]UII77653.1 GNAT family N-acetyltransferase [Flagellimonas sp. HMM57]